MNNQKQSINIVLVGAGYWGSNILRNLKELGVLYAYVDEIAEHNDVKCVKLEEALRDKSVNAFMIATPSNTHASIIEQCLLHHKHVFVEKPLCLSLTEADKLTELAYQKNLVFMVGYLMMYHPITETLKNLLIAGPLQNCTSILIQRQSWVRPRTFESVWWDLCVHDISMLYAIFGQVPKHTNIQTHALEGFGHDSIAYEGSLVHPKGHNLSIHLSASWLMPTKSSSWTLCSPDTLWTYRSDNEFEVNCHPATHHSNEHRTITTEKAYPLMQECKHFITCIEHNSKPTSHHSLTRPIMSWLDTIQTFKKAQNN